MVWRILRGWKTQARGLVSVPFGAGRCQADDKNRGGTMAMDAIVLLREDHKKVKDLFKRFEGLGPNATKTKKETVEKLIEELSVHSGIEEQIFYPAAREVLKDDSMILEDLEEHHIMKWTLSELEGMQPEDERFDAKVNVLIEMVRHHIKEEEEDLFPALRDKLGRKRLQEIGDAMGEAKKFVPKRPHPRAPDTPPLNVIAGATAAVADKVIDLTKEAVRKVTGGR
jgi:hemerythrin-like domain-containing protein